MAKPTDIIICSGCRREFSGTRKRTLLGFREYKCPACGEKVLYPLNSSTRTIYWLGVGLMILMCVGIVASGGIPIPGLLGIAVIFALAKDSQIRGQIRTFVPAGQYERLANSNAQVRAKAPPDEFDRCREAQTRKPTVRPADADVLGPTMFVPKKPHAHLSSGQSESDRPDKREEGDNQNASTEPIGKQVFESSSSPVERRLDQPGMSTITSHLGPDKSWIERVPLGAVVAVWIVFGILAVVLIRHWSKTRPRPSEISAATASKPLAASSPKRASVLLDAKPRRPLAPKKLFAQASRAVVAVIVRNEQGQQFGFGSGFFVSGDGSIVTNYHVIKLAYSATVVLPDNTEFPVRGVLSANRSADLAILKIDAHHRSLPFLRLASQPYPVVGSKVYAIGTPKGQMNTLTDGLVSGIRSIGKQTWIQTNAAISSGSSGGPLLNEYGEVVGVTTLSRHDAQNLNLAVPASEIRRLLAHQSKVQSLASFTEKARHREAKIKALTVEIERLKKAEYWFKRGYNAVRDSDAAYCYQKALSIKPDCAEALFNLGLIYEKNGLYQDAWNAYRRVIRVSGETSDIGRSASKRIIDLRIANKIQ